MIDAHRVTLTAEDDFEGWRDAARDLAEAGVPPEAIVWSVEGATDELFGGEVPQPRGASFAVPRGFVDLARDVICHSDRERFALLYALLWRLRTNRHAMEDRADPLVDRLERLAKDVRRDVHKMHAFVRFREVGQPDGTAHFVAFFEPEHHIVRHAAGFFVRRFTNMRSSKSQKRSTFASSSGASTSSSTQIGAGFVRNRAKISATAVSACSPPDRSVSVDRRLPGGWAMP